MSKIYSRPRIRIPKIFVSNIKNKNSENSKKIVKIFLIMVIAFSTVKLVLDAILPVFNTLCRDKAKSIATIISNEQATIVMKEHSYDELFEFEKDNNGNIVMIKSNISKINEIISDVAVKIQNKIDERGKTDVKISLGTFTGLKIFAGQGPEIYIKVSTVGTVTTDLKSEFKSQGINQTLHRVYLQVDCNINILTPFEDINETISNQILIAENVIVGDIPETYYNINGFDETNELDILN